MLLIALFSKYCYNFFPCPHSFESELPTGRNLKFPYFIEALIATVFYLRTINSMNTF